jgi:hypothetical protein
MAESAAEALASLSVMATQHAAVTRRPSDYPGDAPPGMNRRLSLNDCLCGSGQVVPREGYCWRLSL